MSDKMPVGLKILNVYKEAIDLAIIELGMIHEHTNKNMTFYESLMRDLKRDVIEIEYDGKNLINDDDTIRILCSSLKFTDILYDYIIADLIYNMYPNCLDGTGYIKDREVREIDAYKRMSKAVVKIKKMYFSERDKME